METLNNQKPIVVKAFLVLLVVVSLYFLAKTFSEIKKYGFIGAGTTATNVISFDGKGEVFAAPDLAVVTFTIRENSKDIKDAQDKVTAKETAVLAFLDKSGIDKKDIKAESYNSYPKYDWKQSPCVYSADSYSGTYCPPGKSVLSGYEVSENITVKVRDLSKAGDVMSGVGAVGITEMNGPNFSIEKEDQLKAQARKMAIDEAKAKAESLAKDLGVHLVRIVNFNENGNYPMPMYASGMATKADSMMREAAPAPALPAGENKITSNVTITYEIR